jgi:hypothetical protein
MSEEISSSISFVVSNGNYAFTFNDQELYNQNTLGADGGVQTIGTSEEDLTPVDIATNGWLILKNLDTTNFVTYGPKSAAGNDSFW